MKFLMMVEELLNMSRTLGFLRIGVWVFCVSWAYPANATQSDSNSPRGSKISPLPSLSTQAVPRTGRTDRLAKGSPTSGTPTSKSPSATNATPANVVLTDGSLMVEANNSDLSQILARIAELGGMTIDGSVKSIRVFGVYGPSNPRAVLTDLLKGLGYNFMMVGLNPEGVPRKLELSLQSGNSETAATPAPPPAEAAHPHNSDQAAPDEEQPGPGAILHVPPEGPEDPQERTRQNLQRLQQMHDQQKPQTPPQ